MIPQTELPFSLELNFIENKQLLEPLCSKFINSINTNENLIYACSIVSSHNQKLFLRYEHDTYV